MALFTLVLGLIVKETGQRLLTMVKEREQWEKEAVRLEQRVLILQNVSRGMRDRWDKFWHGLSGRSRPCNIQLQAEVASSRARGGGNAQKSLNRREEGQ
jgi:hypothetical protein